MPLNQMTLAWMEQNRKTLVWIENVSHFGGAKRKSLRFEFREALVQRIFVTDTQ